MAKISFKPGNMLYPLPATMVSVGNKEANIITVAWCGTVCSNPPMVSISVKKERFSHHLLEEFGDFVINLTNEELAFKTDLCGVKSGKDVDKFSLCHFTKQEFSKIKSVGIKESIVNIGCKIIKKEELGSHDMFIAEVVEVYVDDKYIDDKNVFHLEDTKPIAYSHGHYYSLGKEIGRFGYSVKKTK